MALLLFTFLAVSWSTSYAYDCGVINVTSTWGFPLSPGKPCSLTINFPPNMYAKMYLNAVDMDSYDSISIDIRATNGIGQRNDGPTFTSNLSYPAPFYVSIDVDPFTPTKMQIEIQVQLFPSNLGKNVVQAFYPGLDKSTGLIYFDDMKVGDTYTLIPDTTQAYVQAAYIGMKLSQEQELRNIWVYVDGDFTYTMYDMDYWSFLNPLDGLVTIYIAEKPVSLTGALVLNDYGNYVNMYQPLNVYVPLNQIGETATYSLSNLFPDTGLDNCLTIVGAKDGSTPFDVRQIKTDDTVDNDPAYMAFLAGGAVREWKDNGTRLSQSQLPFHVTGNLNTFYVTKGAASVKITVIR